MFGLRRVGPIAIFAAYTLLGFNAFAVQAGVAAGVTGKATIEGNDRPGPQVIKSGGTILTNDTLNTSANARMQALLVDETALTLGPNSSLTIDKFVYDPNKGSGEMVANMVRGSLRFVSGRSSALGKPQFKIKTPVGVMGIRGTSTIIVEREQGQSFFMGLVGPGPDNNVGLPPSKIEFANDYGSQTVDKAGVGFFVEVNQPPGDLIPVPVEISNLFVNKSPENIENQEGEGGEQTAENQEGEGEGENAENQEGEGGEQTAENQEGEGEGESAQNQEGEGGEQTAQNQEGEGGEQTAENQQGEGGQGGENTAANGEGGPPAEGGDGPVATNEGGDGASEGSAGSDNTVVASASDNEPGETGPAGGAGNDPAAGGPADTPLAGGPDNGAGADAAPAPALGGDAGPAPGGGLGGDTQVALAPTPEASGSPGGNVQVTLAPAPALAPEMPVFAAINVEEAAGPGVDIAIPVFVGFGPPGAAGPGRAGPNDNLPVENLTQIINDDVQSIEDTTARFSGTNLNISTSAFIEFDWTGTALVDVDGFLFGKDGTVTTPFLVDDSNSGLSPHPNIRLDQDCVVSGCSEVIIIDSFAATGLYGVGMHLPSAASTSTDFASNRENLFVRVNQGGTLQRASNGGSSVTGGVALREFSPPSSGTGDTWIAAQINSEDGKISEINQILDVKTTSLNGDIGAVTPISISGFTDLTAIANQIDSAQSIINSNLNINTGAFIEFDWTGTALVDVDGFLFGKDGTVTTPFLVDDSNSDPNAPSSIFLDRDCDAISCSEVVTISTLTGTGSGLYGVGMHLPSAASTSTDFASNRENLFVRVNQGGTLQRASNGGSSVTGGTTVARFSPPSSGTGDTWIAAQINPVDGKISEINQILDVDGQSDINLEGFSELTEIANRVDTVQSIVNETLNIALQTMLEFNWSNTSLIDLDAHLNGPNASVGDFHVFFSNTAQENARLENDCTSSCDSLNSASKSEVITITSFNQGGLYRASLFDFAGQSISNNGAFVANRDNIFFKIVQGGTLQRGSNGSAFISGGTEIIKLSPPTSGSGNTWVAANIDPATGQVEVVNKITNFSSSSAVTGIVSQ